MIYPTRRAVILAAVGAPAAMLLGVMAPGFWLIGPGWIALMAGLLLADAALSARRGALALELAAPTNVGVGTTEPLPVAARFAKGPAPRSVELALEADPRLGARPGRLTAEVNERAARGAFELAPARRGEAVMQKLWVRWRGPLGLVWKQTAETIDAVVPVTPDVQGVKNEAVRLFARDAMFGVKVQIDTGDGAEFHALRDFQTGMDRRAVDWKQSARHSALLAKEFRTERNHHIVVALDTGRLMCEPLAGLPRIDRALNAALLLAYVSLRMGDRAGLHAFDAKPRLTTGAVAGVGAFPLLQRMAAKLDYSAEETNYTLGLTALSGSLERRSLVVVFTDFADATSAELMIENIARLLRRHLVLFVVLRDEELEALARAEPHEPEDVSRAVTAAALLHERDKVIARLRRMGVHVVDAPVERVGPALLNAYLDLKRRDLL
ncbi:DUF58 domain-containing protein [Caulobacter sp. 17J65-9]|uniref:DUF58 domain-containing protein n=1 Tax=Caulobacter sp. 17J65-9 TaxID=2709382 RepID=UPI0013CDBA9F|nr:DUF58 domain-containing protein [Caulobacter sp. 17J65-9]